MGERKGKASRERQMQFMEGFSSRAFYVAASEMLYRHGHHWLTDEQMDELISQQVSDWRATQRLNRRNRAISAARAQGKKE